MMQRGTVNTHWRDFVDVYALTRQHRLDGDELHESMVTVANYRQTTLVPLEDTLAGFPSFARPKWGAWRRRQRFDNRVPESFADVLADVISFADPAISDQIKNKT